MRSLAAEMASMRTRRYQSAVSARKAPASTRALTITANATGGAGGAMLMLTLSASSTLPHAAATTPTNLPERRDSQRHGDSSPSAKMWDYLRSRLKKTLRRLLWSLEMLLLWSPVVVSGAAVGVLCQLPLVPEETSSRFSKLWWAFLLKALARSGPTFISKVNFFLHETKGRKCLMFRASRIQYSYLRTLRAILHTLGRFKSSITSAAVTVPIMATLKSFPRDFCTNLLFDPWQPLRRGVFEL